jgi:NADH dehydrogenase (ubiquinone) Fe-S protein 3
LGSLVQIHFKTINLSRTLISFVFKNLFLKMFRNDSFSFNIFIKSSDLYFLMLHFKLASFCNSTQLLDIFSYENSSYSQQKFVCLAFNNLFLNTKFLIITKNSNKTIQSSSELFLNSNWLERETSELSNIFFSNKKDTRNLMLPYGESSSPLLKSFPSIGFYELYFDRKNDLIKSSKVSIQF